MVMWAGGWLGKLYNEGLLTKTDFNIYHISDTGYALLRQESEEANIMYRVQHKGAR